jgi:putative spermidine/putrescine transport system ATP-binding protein
LPAEVRAEGIRKRFGGVTAVDDVHLHVGAGEFFTLLGPSGSGKTTTLRVIAGFERPDAGTVSLDGEDITNDPPYSRDVNTVFQDYALFPHMTVAENVAYGLKVKRVPRAERDQRVTEVLDRVRLAEYGKRKPVQLSGGQRQRVALARSIVNRPKVLLLDEPLGALDLKLRQEMQEFLKALQRELGMTFLYVTHDQEEALTMSDHVAVFNQGKIEQIGTPTEIYEQPATEFVAGFVGTTNILERNGRRFSVRPERIELHLAADAPGEPATIADAIFVGAFTRYLVDTFAGERLTVVRQYDGTRIEPGTPVHLGWRAEDAYEIEPPVHITQEDV